MDSLRLVTLIRRLHLAVRAEVTEELRARGYDDLTPAHIYVFQTPGPDGLRPTELARRALTSKQAMNHLLGGLEARGYLERVAAPGDGRARILRLTPDGRRLTKVIQEISARIERRWELELGLTTIAAIRDGLERLDSLGPPHAPDCPTRPVLSAVSQSGADCAGSQTTGRPGG
jgi:DNA-binding MarR family transcriptional regulator